MTSVAKRPQTVGDTPAAVFVINREDIRRAGATTLPEILRMVPGFEVADLAAGSAAVSTRGFNGITASKLLVLVDGRAIYDSVLPGVPWDQQLVPVEEIERIEVVRGPGAALWGANAVNGVINVVTRHAVDSLGLAASVQADTADSARVFLRQGFQVGDAGALRLYGAARQLRGEGDFAGRPISDWSKAWQAGFRYDGDLSDADSLTLQGDVQRGRYAPVPVAYIGSPHQTGIFSGENLLARWTQVRDAGRTSLQLYYDHTERMQTDLEHDGRRVLDGEFSNQFRLGERHDIVWGLTLRRTFDGLPDAGQSRLVRQAESTYGGYVQDDVTLLPQRLKLSLGAKLEHSREAGWEFQPSVRTIWTDPRGWSLWAAVSKADRTPAAREVSVEVDPSPDLAATLVPQDVHPETLVAYEIGWRGSLSETVALDLTAYYNRYRDLIAFVSTPGSLDGRFIFITRAANVASARAYGVEGALDVNVRAWWTLKAAASWQHIRTTVATGAFVAPLGSLGADHSPAGEVSLRSMMTLGPSVDLDTWVRYVGALGDGLTPAYADFDARLAWRPRPGLELSLRGVNLFGHRSPQLRTDVGVSLLAPSELSDRRVSLTAALRY